MVIYQGPRLQGEGLRLPIDSHAHITHELEHDFLITLVLANFRDGRQRVACNDFTPSNSRELADYIFVIRAIRPFDRNVFGFDHDQMMSSKANL